MDKKGRGTKKDNEIVKDEKHYRQKIGGRDRKRQTKTVQTKIRRNRLTRKETEMCFWEGLKSNLKRNWKKKFIFFSKLHHIIDHAKDLQEHGKWTHSNQIPTRPIHRNQQHIILHTYSTCHTITEVIAPQMWVHYQCPWTCYYNE